MVIINLRLNPNAPGYSSEIFRNKSRKIVVFKSHDKIKCVTHE
jgi:hypothetical protein